MARASPWCGEAREALLNSPQCNPQYTMATQFTPNILSADAFLCGEPLIDAFPCDIDCVYNGIT